MKETKLSPFRSGLLAFIVTFLFWLALLLTQFLFKYNVDLFQKNLETSTLLKMISLTMITLTNLVFPVSLLVFAIVYYRKLFSAGETDLKKQIKKAILPVAIFSLGCFLWNAFIVPKATLHQIGLLFDIRSKAVNEPLKRTNLDLFRRSRVGSNFLEFGQLTDSSFANIDEIRNKTANTILSIADNAEINELLMDSSAIEMGLTNADFANKEIRKDEQFADDKLLQREYLQNYLTIGKSMIESEKQNLLKINIEKSRMLGFPFLLFILFFIGMFIGILNRQQKYLALLILGIYFTVFPALYFLMYWFEKLVKEKYFSPFPGQAYFILALTGIAFLFNRYATSQLRMYK